MTERAQPTQEQIEVRRNKERKAMTGEYGSPVHFPSDLNVDPNKATEECVRRSTIPGYPVTDVIGIKFKGTNDKAVVEVQKMVPFIDEQGTLVNIPKDPSRPLRLAISLRKKPYDEESYNPFVTISGDIKSDTVRLEHAFEEGNAGWVTFEFSPHYDSEEDRDGDIREYSASDLAKMSLLFYAADPPSEVLQSISS